MLQRRSFQSNGEVNPLAKRARTSKLSVEDGVLKEEAANDDDWAPRGYLSLMDGLNSIRWLYILCEVGSEQSIHSYFDWMIKKSRMRGVQVEQFKVYFEKVSWRVCAQLRANRTWKEATEDIMSDVTALQESLLREPAPTPANKRKNTGQDEAAADPYKGFPTKRGKGRGSKGLSGKGAWKGKWQHQDSSRPWQTGGGWNAEARH